MPVGAGHIVDAEEFGPVITSPAQPSVTNTTDETVIASYSIPGDTLSDDDAYIAELSGTADMTSTPTLTLRLRIGGLSGTALAQISYATAANTGRPWWIRATFRCVSAGATGSCHGFMRHGGRIAGGASPGIDAMWSDGSINAQDVDTSSLKDLVVTAQWGTASASNTFRTNYVDFTKRLG